MDERQGKTFAEMVDEAAIRLDYNDYVLAGAVGLMPGKKVISSKQIGRLRAGQMRNYPRALVARLIEILELDPIPAWRAADRWPEGLDPEDISEHLATRGTAAGRVATSLEGARSAAPTQVTDQPDPTTAYFGVVRDVPLEGARSVTPASTVIHPKDVEPPMPSRMAVAA